MKQAEVSLPRVIDRTSLILQEAQGTRAEYVCSDKLSPPSLTVIVDVLKNNISFFTLLIFSLSS
jgi:hypothetical protein